MPSYKTGGNAQGRDPVDPCILGARACARNSSLELLLVLNYSLELLFVLSLISALHLGETFKQLDPPVTKSCEHSDVGFRWRTCVAASGEEAHPFTYRMSSYERSMTKMTRI